MHPERVFEIINNLRVPEGRRKFWPKWSVVFVSSEGIAIDVVQYFEQPSTAQVSKDHERYPGTAYFFAIANESYLSLERLDEKIRSCRDAFSAEVSTLLSAGARWVGQIGGRWTAPLKKATGKDGDA